MKSLSLLLFLFFSLSARAHETRTMKGMESIDFSPSIQELESGEIQYYYELQKPSDQPATVTGVLDKLKALDTHGVLKRKDSGQYYIQISKIAYTVKRPITYFSSKRTCDEAYMKQLYSALTLAAVKNRHCQFTIDPSFPAPGLTMDLYWYDNSSKTGKSLDSSLLNLDTHLDQPAVSIFQYGHDFSRVMYEKTVLSTSALMNYYKISEDETLVMSYTLSFIYNIPPGFLGGAGALEKKFLEQMPPLVDRTETVGD